MKLTFQVLVLIKQESDNFIEDHSQLDEIAQPPDNLYTLNSAYYSKPLEQKFKIIGANSRMTEKLNNIAITLAQLHVQELAKFRKKFSLSKKDYVFVRYGSQICIEQVETLYFEITGRSQIMTKRNACHLIRILKESRKANIQELHEEFVNFTLTNVCEKTLKKYLHKQDFYS
ncbi:hypothetical protein C1645_812426 [Glomus cerebriforme]|uniref:Uncharacterized protein n=1 Tax=Glomus cerebriforme TaxID=658196 RepID=A0A397TUC6_9GLOM|nr:hypothetical protein C1645_812426 [Glomus cerebriforme]